MWFMFCGIIVGVNSSLTIFSLIKRELAALFELYCGFHCSVSLPEGTVGWSAVCNCGIFWSYSLFYWI